MGTPVYYAIMQQIIPGPIMATGIGIDNGYNRIRHVTSRDWRPDRCHWFVYCRPALHIDCGIDRAVGAQCWPCNDTESSVEHPKRMSM
jgi:hypothetical protein